MYLCTSFVNITLHFSSYEQHQKRSYSFSDKRYSVYKCTYISLCGLPGSLIRYSAVILVHSQMACSSGTMLKTKLLKEPVSMNASVMLPKMIMRAGRAVPCSIAAIVPITISNLSVPVANRNWTGCKGGTLEIRFVSRM